jgi:hypothetical protein
LPGQSREGANGAANRRANRRTKINQVGYSACSRFAEYRAIAIVGICQQAEASLTQLFPIDPDTLLRRGELAAALTERGFPTAESTLATKATRGGGPPYQLYGRIPLYRWGSSLAWAESRLSEPRCSTSEGDAPRLNTRQPGGAQGPPPSAKACRKEISRGGTSR